MQINITANSRELEAEFNRLVALGQNLEPVMAEIANYLLNITEEAYESQTSPIDGSAWEPLSDKTLQYKTGKPLYESGKMQDSTSAFHTVNSAGVGLNATANGYPYPIVHQFGSDHVSARTYLPITQDGKIPTNVKNGILDLVVDYFSQ